MRPPKLFAELNIYINFLTFELETDYRNVHDPLVEIDSVALIICEENVTLSLYNILI